MIRISYDRDANEFSMRCDEPPIDWKHSVADALMIMGGVVHMIRFEHGHAAAEALLELFRSMDGASVFTLGDIGEGSYEDRPAAGKTDDRGDCTEDQGVRPAQERRAPGAGGSC